MRRLAMLHTLALGFGWAFALVGGPRGALAVTGVLATLQLALWRLDLARPGPLRMTWHGKRRPQQSIPSYEHVRNAISGASHSPREFDLSIRRPLERIASTRLDAGHGVDMHRDPDAARRLLGPEVWELLDPSRTTSGDLVGSGVGRQRLTDIVDRLERL